MPLEKQLDEGVKTEGSAPPLPHQDQGWQAHGKAGRSGQHKGDAGSVKVM